MLWPMHQGRRRAATVASAVAAGLGLLLTACAGAPVPPPQPQVPSPTPPPARLAFGILPLGGVAPDPLRLAGPYVAAGRLASAPPSLPVVRVPFNPTTAVADLARGLGLAGRPEPVAGGLAYNLGGSAGFQLTTTSGLGTFDLHPNHPVDEIGATPTLAQADRVARAFVTAHRLLGGGGMRLLPGLTRVNGSDRRITYGLTILGRPVVDITGAPARIEVDVATNGFGQMAVVGAGGGVPYPPRGRPAGYRSAPVDTVVGQLNHGAINPGGYRLAADLQPYPPSPAARRPRGARLVADQLAYVIAAGFAVPVYVFQVTGRPGVARFVTCALPTTSCLPLRYAPTPKPTPARAGGPTAGTAPPIPG